MISNIQMALSLARYVKTKTSNILIIKSVFMEILGAMRSCELPLGVHCRAGIGRTGTMIGAYLITKYRVPARVIIGWMRFCRSGMVSTTQQDFLVDLERDNLGKNYNSNTFFKIETGLQKPQVHSKYSDVKSEPFSRISHSHNSMTQSYAPGFNQTALRENHPQTLHQTTSRIIQKPIQQQAEVHLSLQEFSSRLSTRRTHHLMQDEKSADRKKSETYGSEIPQEGAIRNLLKLSPNRLKLVEKQSKDLSTTYISTNQNKQSDQRSRLREESNETQENESIRRHTMPVQFNQYRTKLRNPSIADRLVQRGAEPGKIQNPQGFLLSYLEKDQSVEQSDPRSYTLNKGGVSNFLASEQEESSQKNEAQAKDHIVSRLQRLTRQSQQTTSLSPVPYKPKQVSEFEARINMGKSVGASEINSTYRPGAKIFESPEKVPLLVSTPDQHNPQKINNIEPHLISSWGHDLINKKPVTGFTNKPSIVLTSQFVGASIDYQTVDQSPGKQMYSIQRSPETQQNQDQLNIDSSRKSHHPFSSNRIQKNHGENQAQYIEMPYDISSRFRTSNSYKYIPTSRQDLEIENYKIVSKTRPTQNNQLTHGSANKTLKDHRPVQIMPYKHSTYSELPNASLPKMQQAQSPNMVNPNKYQVADPSPSPQNPANRQLLNTPISGNYESKNSYASPYTLRPSNGLIARSMGSQPLGKSTIGSADNFKNRIHEYGNSSRMKTSNFYTESKLISRSNIDSDLFRNAGSKPLAYDNQSRTDKLSRGKANPYQNNPYLMKPQNVLSGGMKLSHTEFSELSARQQPSRKYNDDYLQSLVKGLRLWEGWQNHKSITCRIYAACVMSQYERFRLTQAAKHAACSPSKSELTEPD